MGWLSDFFSGGSQKSNATQDTTVNKQQTTGTQTRENATTNTDFAKQTNSIQETGQRTKSSETSTTNSSFNTRNMDEASLNTLQQALGQYASALDPNVIGALAQGGLKSGMAGAENFLNFAEGTTARAGANINAIMGEARRQGEISLGQQTQALAGQTGSTANTLMQQLGNEGRINLESALAGQQGSLLLQADQQEAQNRAAAVNAILSAVQGGNQSIATGSGAVSDLGGVIKGAVQSGTATSTTQTDRTSTTTGQTLSGVGETGGSNQYSTTDRAALEAIDALIQQSTNGTQNTKNGLNLGTVLGWLG